MDHLPRWLDGSDTVFAELVAVVPWRQRTVPMYDRMVKEPRLVWWWTEADGPRAAARPGPAAAAPCAATTTAPSTRWGATTTGPAPTAWPGTATGCACVQVDPLVAIVSVGAPRPFLLRPRGGGPSRSFLLGHGDLLVMGGAAQHDWEHAVPKVAAAGPRISITYRHAAEPPAALRDGRARHPSAGAQNRHLPATGSANGPGRLEREGRTSTRLGCVRSGDHTEGPPS